MFTTLSKRLTILFLALLSAGFVCAEEWMKSGLHCGQIVVLTATPEPDYRFSGWSDGNTDNPRRVEVTKAMELQALFVSACEAQYILPVTSSGGDDVLVTTGYYLSRDGLPGGQYYAQCNFPNPESERCDIVLRSQVYYVSLTGLTDAEGASLRLIPTVSDKGQLLTLTGMPVTEPATVSVFDMSGRLLWRAVSDATETMSFAAQAAAGCYLVHVKTSRLDQTLLYIVR